MKTKQQPLRRIEGFNLPYPQHTKYIEGYKRYIDYWQKRYSICATKWEEAWKNHNLREETIWRGESYTAATKLCYFLDKQQRWEQRENLIGK